MSTGQISIQNITAQSGYWQDIQDAIDQIGGIGNVHIPVGTFDFVDVGESWSDARVVIPAGVNLFGAPTERDANGQVIIWGTVLRLPWNVPGSWYGGVGDPPQRGGPETPFWFSIEGSSDPNENSRFSDIKLEGDRVIDPDSKMIVKGINIENVVGFRVDHVYLEGVAGGVSVMGSRGVIDHSKFVNHEGYVVGDFSLCTVGYGVQVYRAYGDYWEDDVSKVMGKYTDYTVFIEDSYFEKWRHITASGAGAHYVLRYNTIKDDFGYGSIDSHGRTQVKCVEQGHLDSYVYDEIQEKWVCSVDGSDLETTLVGTRATEIYNNEIIDAVQYPWGTFTRGGAGVAFNNTVGGGTYTTFFYMSNEGQEPVSKCWNNDWWIWNNTLLGVVLITEYDPLNQINEGENYFLHAPHTFSYEPYPYPHPLTTK